MKINLETTIKHYDGTEIVTQEYSDKDGNGLPLTYQRAIWSILNSQLAKEEPSVEDKLFTFQISTKIAVGGDVELEHQEIAFILKRAGLLANPLVFGRLKQLFGDIV